MSATTRRFISRNVPSRCIFFLQDAECAIDVVARTKKPSERRVREKAERPPIPQGDAQTARARGLLIEGIDGKRRQRCSFQHRMVCEASIARGKAIWKQDKPRAGTTSSGTKRSTEPFWQPITRCRALSSRAPETCDARPSWTICVIDAGKPPPSHADHIVSAARSQPDRIGPLCPIPNQSTPVLSPPRQLQARSRAGRRRLKCSELAA